MVRDWYSVHLFYHDLLGIENYLLPEITLLCEELQARQLVSRWFFIRYWEGGPHLRLRFFPTESVKQVREFVQPALKTILDKRPAKITFQKEEYYQRVISDPSVFESLSWYPNNSIQEISYQPEWKRYGGKASMDLIHQLFEASSVVTLSLMNNKDSQKNRTNIALALLAIHLDSQGLIIEDKIDFLEAYARRWGNHKQQVVKRSLEERMKLGVALHNPSYRTEQIGIYAEKMNRIWKALYDQKDWLEVLEPEPDAYFMSRPLASVSAALLHMTHNRLAIPVNYESILALTAADALRSLF